MRDQLFLLPNKFKIIGWLLFIPGLVAGVLLTLDIHTFYFPIMTKVYSIFNPDLPNGFSGVIMNDIYDEIVGIMISIGGLMVVFSKEKFEGEASSDDALTRLRLKSLAWGVFLHYILTALGLATIFDLPFLTFMNYNMFTVLIIYILRFNYCLYLKKTPSLS